MRYTPAVANTQQEARVRALKRQLRASICLNFHSTNCRERKKCVLSPRGSHEDELTTVVPPDSKQSPRRDKLKGLACTDSTDRVTDVR